MTVSAPAQPVAVKKKPSRNRGIGGSDAAPAFIDVLAWYYLLRERVWWIVAGVVAAVAAASVYLAFAERIYTAQCVIQVEQEGQRVLSKVEDVNPEDFKTLEALKSVEGGLTSRSLLLRVMHANKLDKENPDFQSKPGKPLFTDSDYADIMQQIVDAKLRRGTRLIDISVDDPDPVRATRVAKSIVEEYIRNNFEQKAEANRLANSALFQQRDELKARLEKTEQELQALREKYNTNSLEEKQNTTADRLKELNKQLQEARSQRIKLEGELPMLQKADSASLEDLLALESVANAKPIDDLRKLLAPAEATFGEAKKRYLSLHPKYQQAEAQVIDLRRSLETTARRVAAAQINAIGAARDAEGKLQQGLTEQERLGVELQRQAIPYNMLMHDAEADRALYDQVTARVRELDVTKKLDQASVRIVQLPDVPADPSSPHRFRVLAAALVLGGGLPVLGIVLLQATNTSFRSVDDAEMALDLPSLAAVPQARGKAAHKSLVLIAEPAGREAESFRCLRTSLVLLAESEAPGRTVLMTSAVPAEGKSYCSSNCAVAFAQQGLRTLLIDADLRRPAIGAVFGLDREAAGASDVLSLDAKFEAACHGVGIENLTVMPGGTKRANPAELLGGDAFRKLLELAREKFDRVVLDTAPVNAVSDTLLIADEVDAVVVVIRSRRTPARAVLRAKHMLELAEAPLAGFVLNRLPRRLANYYYYDEGSYTSAGVYGT